MWPGLRENMFSGFPDFTATEDGRGLKFRILEVEGFTDCTIYGANKGADQLHGYHAADLRLCFHICKIRFSHDTAHNLLLQMQQTNKSQHQKRRKRKPKRRTNRKPLRSRLLWTNSHRLGVKGNKDKIINRCLSH